ncbi:hypothetical protein GCM10023205_21860 [Yinghuangia aomiensis]|uniref:Uncharacterized protein n=1 Tax=Yinghuangia aomiensis TaxID=676205 RepID=A0ABP9H5Y4_9ACTN
MPPVNASVGTAAKAQRRERSAAQPVTAAVSAVGTSQGEAPLARRTAGRRGGTAAEVGAGESSLIENLCRGRARDWRAAFGGCYLD